MEAVKKQIVLRALLAIIICALAATGNSLMAQRGGGRPGGNRGGRMDPAQMQKQMIERSQEQYKKMCETLVLDENQRVAADKLFEKTHEERDKLFEDIKDDKLSGREAMEKMRAVQEDFLTEFATLLNSEQQERFELIKKEMRKQRPARRNRN